MAAGACRGFTDDEVAERSHDFMEHLGANGLFVAGSSGVQGEWPKVLLTRARDGLLYLDHTVPDGEAAEHYIVKFGRGPNQRLETILRQEAPYMAVAAHLGLNVHAPLKLRERALFIPRFDRRVTKRGVTRIAQESIAALTGRSGFGPLPSHDEVCRMLAKTVTHPLRDIIEYIKRDVANLAMGNKDNHARNTALQRDFQGRIGLAPLFDFAPMYLHPDGIARRIRWQDNDDGAPDWQRVVDRVSEECALSRKALVKGLQAMVAPLDEIAKRATDHGVAPDVHAFLRQGIVAQAQSTASSGRRVVASPVVLAPIDTPHQAHLAIDDARDGQALRYRISHTARHRARPQRRHRSNHESHPGHSWIAAGRRHAGGRGGRRVSSVALIRDPSTQVLSACATKSPASVPVARVKPGVCPGSNAIPGLHPGYEGQINPRCGSRPSSSARCAADP